MINRPIKSDTNFWKMLPAVSHSKIICASPLNGELQSDDSIGILQTLNTLQSLMPICDSSTKYTT